MGDAYTPGLTVTRSTVVRKARRLPLPGRVLVEVGTRVAANDVVARTELPGKVTLVNVATALGLLPDEIDGAVLVGIGAGIVKGQPIARTKTWFGWSHRDVVSPIDGTLESVSNVTGMAVLREPPSAVEVHAYVDGIVVEVMAGEGVVVETRGAMVQGIFGLGGERQAKLVMIGKGPEHVLEPADFRAAHRGCIVVGGARATLAAIRRAFAEGVAAVVCGGFAYHDVRELLGYDLGVAVTGTEPIATTLIVTEGFGDIAMAAGTYELLASFEGKHASVNGATQIRAGVIRPEVIVPDATAGSDVAMQRPAGLAVGASVRCIRAPYFGQIGTIAALPVELARLPSETKVRVLEVELAGKRVTIPRANVEVIER